MRPSQLIPTCALLMVALASARHQALPYLAEESQQEKQQEPPDGGGERVEADAQLAARTEEEEREDCDRSERGPLAPKVVACLTGCAECVKQWRSGVYNGRSCARDCLEQQQVGPLDPDCSLVKYFNSTLLASVV